MNRHFNRLAGAAALALAIVALAASAGRGADDEEKIIVPKATADMVNKLADEAAKGEKGDNKKAADEFAKKNPEGFKKIMWVFKPRVVTKDNKVEGGFGVGPLDKMMKSKHIPDEMDLYISTSGDSRKPALAPAALKAAGPDLERLADVTSAIGDLTHAYTPKKAAPGKNPKDWTKWTDNMKKSALDLKAAVKNNDPIAAKKALSMIHASCSQCHGAFRD